jgi:hypothetical protein
MTLVGAPVWGTGGPEFKSRRSDHEINDLALSLLAGKPPVYKRFTETVLSPFLPQATKKAPPGPGRAGQ